MDRLTIEDLLVYKKDLASKIKEYIKYDYKVSIKEPSEDNESEQRPIAELIIEINKLNKTNCYGVLIFPNNRFYIPILNYDFRGAKISVDIYDEIRKWIQTLPSQYYRQVENSQNKKGAIRKFDVTN